MNSLEFIKQHVTEWPNGKWGVARLRDDGIVIFGRFLNLHQGLKR